MGHREAFKAAEKKIKDALRTGATELNLSFGSRGKESQLRELPKSLGQLAALQTLHLGGNQLAALPESLGQLTALESLHLNSNQLAALPDSFGQLTALESLYLGGNQLAALPDSFGQLTALQTLHLYSNQLAALPESLGQLTALESLHLGGNQLAALPDSFGQLTALQTLHLNSNQLAALPESFGQLTALESLHLDGNQLAALPDSFGQLTALQSLHLGGNQLAALPDSLGQLTALQTLHLGGNQLAALPDSFGQLTALQTLHLGGNQLAALPDSLQKLNRLEQLCLHNNDLLEIPVEILGPNWIDVLFGPKSAADPATILDYYFSSRGKQGRALRELKLVVVGRGGAGKTSLIKRLNGDRLDPQESETHGINISPLKLDCHDGPVTARVWDFGGQHVLHAMHEFFLTARSLYLLVLGEREDMAERDAAYWLQLIRSYAGQAPVVVALNKNKGQTREMDRESLEKNYGPILDWIPTDCAEGYDQTIKDLEAALTKAADGMREIRDRFPAKWWEIKEWLEQMEDPYLDFPTYQKQCRELGEPNPENQETLAAWLNDLGIAINYSDDQRLHNTTVLQPQWLANGIYAILRANDSNHDRKYAPEATLTVESLGPIYAASQKLKMLDAADYPADKWPFLLQLMCLFRLAFPIDDSGETLLVPTLLPLEPPDGSDLPDDEERDRLRYEFSVVPGPLLPKLLVQMFSLIEEEKFWRRGAILQFGDARARVWTTQDERWIRITAIGDKGARRELLTMIRETLRELFAEYKDLHADEQWEYNGKWVPRETLEEFGVLPAETKEVLR